LFTAQSRITAPWLTSTAARAVRGGLGDDLVEAGEGVLPVLAAGDRHVEVAGRPRHEHRDVHVLGLVVPAHLELARGDFPQAAAHLDGQAASTRERPCGALRTHLGRRVYGLDRLVREQV
jgi:hypothetical protein